MTTLSWALVIDRPTQQLEFGACHVRYAWRRHKRQNQKFLDLEHAFLTSDHRLTKLLQEVNANPNAKNHTERGQAVFAAVWYSDSTWAILCTATHATLVSKQELEQVPERKVRDDLIVATLQGLFDRSPQHLRRKLVSDFFNKNIGRTISDGE